MNETRDTRFVRILREYGDPIARLVACYEDDGAEREDLMQEIAFSLWRALPNFREECGERTFVYRIAHNRALTHRWRRARQRVSVPLNSALPDPGPDPAVWAGDNDRRHRLLVAVRQLPNSLREPVVLRLEGLKDREIADVLGLSEGNVAVRLTRARRALRALLGEGAE